MNTTEEHHRPVEEIGVIPDGFTAFDHPSPFLARIGPVYRSADPLPRFGILIEQRHSNSRGQVHGSMLSALADVILGHTMLAREPDLLSVSTVSMTLDFIESTPVGSWIEMDARIGRVGWRLAFANGELRAGEVVVAQASAVFAVDREERLASP